MVALIAYFWLFTFLSIILALLLLEFLYACLSAIISIFHYLCR